MTENARQHFIVTADDYGIRQTAEPILRLVREGHIDRVAVLIHYVSKEQALELLATGVKIDIHLELINLLKSGDKMYGGVFMRVTNFVLRFFSGYVTSAKAEKEWRIQIARFRELFGRLPDGFNSHEYVHHFPVFFRLVLKLAKEYDISFVRFGRRGMLVDMHHKLVGKILSTLWKRSVSDFEKSRIATSDYLVSFDWIDDFAGFSQNLPDGTIELVVHPEREEEYRAILDSF